MVFSDLHALAAWCGVSRQTLARRVRDGWRVKTVRRYYLKGGRHRHPHPPRRRYRFDGLKGWLELQTGCRLVPMLDQIALGCPPEKIPALLGLSPGQFERLIVLHAPSRVALLSF